VKAFWTLIVLLLAIIVSGTACMFLGLYNISAANKEGMMQNWMLSTTMESSVRKHSKGINIPPLGDSSQIATGFEHFQEMCVSCHGAPGVSRSEIGEGLNPRAPDLPKTTIEWNNAELFWILKNGIKMTGMPSFGATHSDKQIWAIVSFVRRLEKMTPDEYQKLTEARPE
jgi:mono/diheme cytochrome c family protein